MLLILLSSIFLIPVLIGCGKVFDCVLPNPFDGVYGKALHGIFGICIIWTILAFFIPLNSPVEISTILIGLFFFFKGKTYKEFNIFSKKDYILTIVISVIILFCGSFYPFILDHFGYYVPTIKWLTEIGMVRGISNLDLTLGQMSVWHIFQSGFSNLSDPFLRMNSVLLIIYALYIIEEKSWIQLCFLPVLLLFSQSPSPDLPVIVLSLIILMEILKGNKSTASLFAFSVFVFAIKPTMIWLPIVSFLYSLFIIKSSLKILIPGFLILILFFVKNIWTFGYPIFPISIGDVGVSWKLNKEVLRISSQFAIQKTYDMQYSYQEISRFTFADYIKNWLFLDGIKSVINISFIISLIALIIFSFIKKNKIISLICFSIIIKSILVILFSAQYRFFIDVFFVIFLLFFFNFFNKKRSVVVFSIFSIIIIGFLTVPSILQTYIPSFRLGNFMGRMQKEQIYIPSQYSNQEFNNYKVGNLSFHVSKRYPYNFDTKLPAISESYIFDDVKAGIFPQLADKKNIRKGFTWKTLDAKERSQAEKVINSIKNTYQQNK
ncbi:LIC_10190 family membrane protein [Chryseobacterium taichungense]|uniref:LIC_10190 family membrane protein n=1 Tax=Chryseobacterium taichungense TaxID=295069 RepID=UPI0028A8E500|nr:hypothetical protein [Chryseobacterium taichungense]